MMAISNETVAIQDILPGDLIIHAGKLYEATRIRLAGELHGYQVTVTGRATPITFQRDELVTRVTL